MGFKMTKVYCCVYNGIGNQLFGYALGLYLAKKYNKEIYIDLTKLNQINFLSKIGLKKDTRRNYELHKIGYNHPIKNFTKNGILRKFKFLRGNKFILADFRKNYPDLSKVGEHHNIYSIGFSESKIIKQVLPDMRAGLAANFELNEAISEVIEKIQKTNSVAIHIRRTDYLDTKLNSFATGISTDEYYKNAIRFIKEKIENPHFIIFSDDSEYVKEELEIENSFIVEGNAGYEDFYLLSLCKHFILANSTFGFWAASLSKNQNKTVCVPENWYNNPKRDAEFIPTEWEKIPIN